MQNSQSLIIFGGGFNEQSFRWLIRRVEGCTILNVGQLVGNYSDSPCDVAWTLPLLSFEPFLLRWKLLMA